MNTHPEVRTRSAFKLIGVERYTSNGIASIQEAWAEFTRRATEIPHQTNPNVCYGFEDYSRDFIMEPDAFPKYYYISSVEVDRMEDIPEGMVGKEVSESDYAVFTYRGSLAGLPKFFQFIYGDWLPTSGYKMNPTLACDFERYPEPVKDMENALVEIWVAVVKN